MIALHAAGISAGISAGIGAAISVGSGVWTGAAIGAPIVAVALLQPPACTPDAARLLAAAEQQARSFDLPAAIATLATPAAAGCSEADVASWYWRGLSAARAAYRDGGSPEALAPVTEAVAALERLAGGAPGPAEIARVTLLAASAAAQSEREEMAVFLDFALRLEALQFAAAQPGAPGVTAHEAAGDLWLQVHRYADAQRAYDEAARKVGETPRVLLGIARVGARLGDPSACSRYRAAAAVLGRGDNAPALPPSVEAEEAQRYIDGDACRALELPKRP